MTVTGSVFDRPAPRTTVICAVWHGDPERRALLAGHRRNLDRQSVPVDRVYVFDGGDMPPPDLGGEAIVAGDDITIYEAWNLALTRVRTPFVMNLNLDDRLCVDAVARLEAALDAGADFAGGDWQACFSRAETDAVGAARPLEALPPTRSHPPRPGFAARMGWGHEVHGFGPACLWRMALHVDLPFYPDRLTDGTRLRVIGDAVWLEVLLRAGKKRAALPWIVGHYHSHPGDQAEFRYDRDGEREKAQAIGVALV